MKEFLVLEFDAAAYSVIAVQKACYRFTDTASFEIQQRQRDQTSLVVVTLTPLASKSPEGLEHLGQLLRNEALDQSLREQIRAQTDGVRNLILAHAFSQTGLIAADSGPQGS